MVRKSFLFDLDFGQKSLMLVTPTSFEVLPNEILKLIISFLSKKDAKNVALTSKRMYLKAYLKTGTRDPGP